MARLKSDELKRWKSKLHQSNAKHKREDKKIDRYRDYYRGKQWGHRGLSSDAYTNKVIDNIIFSNIKTIVPSINFRNPKIFVSPTKKPYRIENGVFDTVEASVLLELLLNYYYRTLQIKSEVDKSLLDALLGPWGFLRIGYTLETEKSKKDGELMEVNELIKSESPFVTRISPKDIRIDPEAKDHLLRDATWVAFRWIKRLDDLKANPNLKNTENLKSNYTFKVEPNYNLNDDPNLTGITDEWDRVEGWDIWDKRDGRIIKVVDSHDKALRVDDWPLQYEGFPLETIYFNENPDELFPISDLEIYIPNQDELNRVRSLMLDHARRISQRKYVAGEAKFKQTELDKITHGGDGVIALVQGDPTGALIPVQDATISQDLWMVTKMIKGDIREESGITQFEKGIAQKFETATEPALLAQSVGMRKQERVDILERFMIRVITKLSNVLQQTLSDTQIPLDTNQFRQAQQLIPQRLEKIVGPNAEAILPWVSMNKDDILGDYNFEIEVGSSRPMNDEVRKQETMMVMQVAQQNPYINGEEATKDFLEAHGSKDLDRLMVPGQQIQQQQAQAQQAEQGAEQQKEETKKSAQTESATIRSEGNILATVLKLEADKNRPKGGGSK